jgi:hypothetical protein
MMLPRLARNFSAWAGLLLAAGCATGGLPGVADFRSFTRADVAHALQLAEQASDPGAPYRARCYVALLYWLPADGAPGVSVPDVKGLVSAYEVAAELEAKARQGSGLVPESVEAECAYVKSSLIKFAARKGAGFAPVPGAGALGGMLK